MSADGETRPDRYGAWSRDRQGWFLGLGGGQLVTVAGGGAPLLAAMGAHAWLVALAWLPVWAAVVVLTVVPVRGRPAFRWALDSLHRAVGVVSGWSDWQSQAATGASPDLTEADLPGVLSGIRTHDGPPTGLLMERPAVVLDNRERTWAVVARVTHTGIGLAEAAERNRMGAGLAQLLEGAATGELVSVLALQVRTVPDDGAERAAWQHRHLRADAPALALEVNTQLGTLMTQAGVRHETFVTVVVPEAKIARHAREAGGGVDGRARVLYGVMSEVEAGLRGAFGASAVAWLGTPALAAAVRTGFAPGDRAGLVAAELSAAEDTGVAAALPMGAAGPSSAPPAEIRHYAHDAWNTATCTVLLPDKGAVMGALAPVLTPTSPGERRCVTVFYEPISHDRAERIIGNDSMSSGMAQEMRRRGGFVQRASHRRDADRVAGQDIRLADGHALVRVAVAAAVTVPNTWSIADYGRRLEANITAAGFKPLRLDLAQDAGMAAACVPLGVGLARRRSLG